MVGIFQGLLARLRTEIEQSDGGECWKRKESTHAWEAQGVKISSLSVFL